MEVLISGRERLRLMTINLIDMLKARGYDMKHEEAKYKAFSAAGAVIEGLDNQKHFQLNGRAVHPQLRKRIGYTVVGSEKATSMYTSPKSINSVATQKFLRPKDSPEEREGVHSIIVVIDKPIQENTLRNYDPKQIEVFQINDLLQNITKHVLVPEHRLMTSVEKEVFLGLTGVSESQLPGAHVNDPVIRYYGAKLGDLVYVQRYEIKNAGVVRSRPQVRIVRHISESFRHPIKSPVVRRGAEYYKPKGRDVDEMKTMRRGAIRTFRRVPNTLPDSC